MCDIWKNQITGELAPAEYEKLPASLRDINITGGEPFLRRDLADIVAVIKERCRKARLIISTNGFATGRMQALLPDIVVIDPRIGLRVSVDGHGKQHDEIRGVKGAYEKCLAALSLARQAGVTDLGLSMTVMDRNVGDIRPVQAFCEEQGLALSITTATASPIYFGADKLKLAPRGSGVTKAFHRLAQDEYLRWRPIGWVRAWHQMRTIDYLRSGARPLRCDAGSGFFYLDSLGQVFACHLQPYRMGNIREDGWAAIWTGAAAQQARSNARECEKCWSICTSKSQIRRQLLAVGLQVAGEKARAHLGQALPEAKADIPAPERAVGG